MQAFITLIYSLILFISTSIGSMKKLLTPIWERVVCDARCMMMVAIKSRKQAIFSGVFFAGDISGAMPFEQSLLQFSALFLIVFFIWFLLKIIRNPFSNLKLLKLQKRTSAAKNKKKYNAEKFQHNFEFFSKDQKKLIFKKQRENQGHIFLPTKYPALAIFAFLLLATFSYNLPEKYQLMNLAQSMVEARHRLDLKTFDSKTIPLADRLVSECSVSESYDEKTRQCFVSTGGDEKTIAQSQGGQEMVLAEAIVAPDDTADQEVSSAQATADQRKTVLLTGVLTDNEGKPVEGKYVARFAIYTTDRKEIDPYPSDADRGSRIWEESQTITFKKGLFSVNLGIVNDLPVFTNLTTSQFYVGMRIGSDSEMAPRRKVGTPFFSLNSANALLLNGKKVGIQSGDIIALNDNAQVNLQNLPVGTAKDQLVLGSDKRLKTLTISGASFISASGQTLSVKKINLNSDIQGSLPVAYGGTGLGSYAVGDMLYYASGDALNKLPIGTNGQLLIVSSGVPTWSSTLPGSSHELLSASHPDTTAGTVARGDLITGQGASASWSRLAIGASGQFLRSDGVDVNWYTLTKSDINLGSVENIALTTWAGSTNLTTLGTITSGVWNATVIDVAHGGTGVGTFGANYLLKGNGTSTLASSMIYDNGTNIGIGTISPGELLHISATSDGAMAGNIRLSNLGTSNNTGSNVQFYSGSGLVASIEGKRSTAGNGLITLRSFASDGITVNSRILMDGHNNYIRFDTNAGEKVRIDSQGNVGIGTTSPAQKLDVNGSAQIYNISGVSTLTLRAGSGQATNPLQQWLDSSGNSLAVLSADGRLGIGTTNPADFKLEVAGDIGPESDNTRNLGSSTKYFNTAYIKNLVTGTSGAVGYWNRTGNVLSPITNGDTMAIYAGASNTSGILLSIAYTGSATLTGALTGTKIDLNDGYVIPTNQSITGLRVVLPTTTNTNLAGTTVTMDGMSLGFGVGTGINQNGAGTTIYSGANLLMPALTQTAGTLIANGALITTSSSITTGGTANGINISATGVGAGALNGLLISSITGSGGTETALSVGSGWDNVFSVGGNAVINGSGVVLASAGGTGIVSYSTGDIIYADSSSTFTKLAGGVGNNGKALVISGGVPAWGVVSGSTCADCVLNDPTSVTTQTITPNNQDISSLVVRQTTFATPTQDIFAVTNATGSTRYFYVDQNGNVSTGGVASQSITLTPTSDTTALTLVGSNVPTANLQYINSKNTQGVIFNLAYGVSATLAGALTGAKIDLATNLTATDQSVTGINLVLPSITNTTSTSTYRGLVVALSGGAGINQNGAGATIFSGIDVTVPPLTQTSGSLTGNGILITTPSSITTGGTANGLNISATGVGVGILRGVNIGNITAGAGAETALRTGTGWDYAAIFEGGNVGIGTTSPVAKLDVWGADAGATTGDFTVNTATTGGIVYIGKLSSTVSSSNKLIVRNRLGTETFVVDNNSGVSYFNQGNVGIGTTGPVGKLSITTGTAANTYGVVNIGDNSVTTNAVSTILSIKGALNPSAGLIGINSEPTINASSSSGFYGINIKQTIAAGATQSGMLAGLYLSSPTITGTISGSRYGIYQSSTLDSNYFAGNLGIGTASPSQKLEVSGKVRFLSLADSWTTPLEVINTGTDSTSVNAAIFKGYAQSLRVGVQSYYNTIGGTAAVNFWNYAGSDVASFGTIIQDTGGTTPKGDFFIKTNDGSGLATRMTILNGGNVGIGTTGPGSLLEVAGAGQFGTAAATTPQITVLGGAGGNSMIRLSRTVGATVTFDWSLSGGGLAFGVSNANSRTVVNIFGDNSTQNELYVGQRSSSTNGQETRNSLLSGTTISTEMGTDKGGGNFTIQGNLGTGAGTPGDIFFNTGTILASGATPQTSATRMTIKNNTGNVGIGTTGPGAKLHLNAGSSTGQRIDIANNYNALLVYGTGGTVLSHNMYNDSNGYAYYKIYDHTGTAQVNLSSYSGSATYFNTGNVGIGTTSPGAKLEVYDASSPILRLRANGGNPTIGGAVDLLEAGDVNGFGAASNIGFRIVYDGSANYLKFKSGNEVTVNDRLVINRDNGNVGIGTTSPGAKLHIAQSGAVAADNYATAVYNTATSSTDALNKYGMYLSSTGTWNGLGATNYGLYVDVPTGGETNTTALFAGSLGNILLMGSGADLQFSRSGANYITASGASGSLGFRTGGTNTRLNIDSSGNFAFNTSQLYIQQSSGNVGIGTTGPASLLEVAGKGQFGTAAATTAQLVINGGTSGTDMIQLVRSTGSVLTYGWSLNGGALAFKDVTNNVITLNTYSESGKPKVMLGARGSGTGTTAGLDGYILAEDSDDAGVDTSGGNLYLLSGLGRGAGTASKIYFQTPDITTSGTGAQTMTTKMMILGNGNVGIGTTGPGAGLEILKTTSQLKLSYDASNYGTFTVDSGGQMSVSATGGFTLAPVTGQEVVLGGVGLTNNIRIQRLGNSTSGATMFNSNSLFFRGSYWNGSASTIVDSGIYEKVINTTPTYGLAFSVGGSDKMFITNSGNVGIGTTGPIEKLDISGALRISGARSTGTGASGFLSYESGGVTTLMGNGTDASTVGQIQLSVRESDAGGPIDALRINNLGNVGIGTASPGAKLDIYGSSRFGSDQTVMLTVAGGASETAIRSRLVASDSTSQLSLNGNPLRFLIASDEKVRIDNNGNVGIGTTSPGVKLDILGVVTAGAQLRLRNVDTDATVKEGKIAVGHYTNSEEDVLALYSYNSSGNNYVYIGGGSSTNNAASILSFYTASNNTTLTGTERMRIDNNGNVGIGTTGPGNELEVNGRFRTTSQGNNAPSGKGLEAMLYGGTTALIQGYDRTGTSFIPLQLQGSVISLMQGNVGIGTTSPGFPLHVLGNVAGVVTASIQNMYGNAAGDSQLILGTSINSGSQNVGAILYADRTDAVTSGDTDLLFKNSAGGTMNTNMVIKSTGNVGIGTTNPGSKLDVVSASASQDVKFRTTTSGLSSVIVEGYDSSTNPAISGAAGGKLILSNLDATANTFNALRSQDAGGSLTNQIVFLNESDANNQGAMSFWTRPSGGSITEAVRINSSGNVGIGTTGPGYLLEIAKNGTGGGLAIRRTDASPTLFTMLNVGNQMNFAYDGNSFTFNKGISVGSTYSASAPPTSGAIIQGNVGIGTTSPGGKLEVSGAGATTMYVTDTTDSAQIFFRASLSSGLGTASSNSYSLYSNNLQRLKVQYDGKIGINTDTVVSQLGVVGNLAVGATYGSLLAPTSGAIIEGNVGIGTTSPGQALDVVGVIRSSQAGNLGRIDFGTDAYNSIYRFDGVTKGTAGNQLRIDSYDGISFGTSKTAGQQSPVMYIKYDGNVGIGTTGPGAKLEISSITGTASIIPTSLRISTQSSASDWDTTNPWGTLDFYSSDTSSGGPKNHARIGTIATTATGGASHLGFYVDDGTGVLTERMRILNSGNVGIGTTSPQTPLHVYSSSAEELRFERNTSSNVAISFKNTDGQTYIGRPSNTANSVFAIASSATLSVDSYLLIDKSGNVGIGTTSPGAKLDVRGSIAGGTNGTEFTVSAAGVATWSGGGSANSNTAYSHSQAVTGAEHGAVSTNTANMIVRRDGSGNFSAGTITAALTGAASLNVLKTGDTMSGNLTFNNSGLGIYGTYSSSAYLNVFSIGASYGPLADGSSLSSMYGIAWANSTVGGQTKTGLQQQALFVNSGVTQTAIGTGIWTLGGYTQSGTSANTITGTSTFSNATYSALFTGGNVGIGTTAPTQKLSVSGTNDVRINITSPTASGATTLEFVNDAGSISGAVFQGGSTYAGYGGGNSVNILNVLNAPITLGTNNLVRMTILSGGNIGIGTTNPDYALRVQSGAVAGNGAYVNLASHSTKKENFEDISVLGSILALNIKEWQYKTEYALGDNTRHLYPFADDFFNKFGLGKDEWRITAEDMAGVALKGIQELATSASKQQIQISGLTENQNKITEQLTGQLADQNLTVDNKLQLIGQTLTNVQTQDLASLRDQIAGNTANISGVSADLEKLQDQYNTIQDQYSTLSEILLISDGVYDFKQAVLKSSGIVAGAFTVKVTPDKPKTIGEAYICPAGFTGDTCDTVDASNDGKSVLVQTSAVSASAKIFVTAENDTDGAVWVEKKSDNSGFKIHIKPTTPITEKIKINWWIVEEISQ